MAPEAPKAKSFADILQQNQEFITHLQALQEDGVLAIGGGSSVVRLLPPLVIPEDQWSSALDALGRTLSHG